MRGSGGRGMAIVLQPETGPELEYKPEKVEEHLLDRNITHFGQSKVTPWTKPPFFAIPATCTRPIADSILDGTFQPGLPGSTGRYLKLLLKALKTRLPELPAGITKTEISQGFRAWK
jgi:hypothetical protein